MNNYVYRAGTTPKHVYIVIKGNIKIDTPGFEIKNINSMAIVGEYSIFGQNDLN